jgi:predicted phosphodiesterase
MKKLLLPLLSLLIILLSNADARFWTNTEGKQFEGELVEVKGNAVTIRRTRDRIKFTVPIAGLSQEDQEYLKKLEAEKMAGGKTKPFTFVQMCDTQLGMGGYEHDKKTFAQAVKQINKLRPDFTVICGDLVHNANEKSFADFKTIKKGFTARCYCAPGNHDVKNKPTVKSLEYYRKHIGKDYYSFLHKGYTFIVVNTQLWVAPLEGETQKHDKWVKDALIKAKELDTPIFVIAHYPLFTKTPDEKNHYYNIPIKIRTKLLNLYTEHGVIAVLAGHTHSRIINDYKGIQLVNGEATSRSKPALGFRLWNVNSVKSVKHKFIPLEVKFNGDGTIAK